MADQSYIGPVKFRDVLPDLLERVHRIKVMLWAGDAEAARAELGRVVGDYEELMFRALKVKSKVYVKNRDSKQEALSLVREWRESGIKGWEAHYLTKVEQAKNSALADPAETDLFAVSPVVSLLTKLDRRVAEETEQEPLFTHITTRLRDKAGEENTEYRTPVVQTVDPNRNREVGASSAIHQASGFSISISQRDEGRWDVRGYQLHPPPLDPARLLQALNALPDVTVEPVAEPTRRDWPLQIRGFSTDGHFDLTVFDSGRFIFSLVVRQEKSVEDWGETIMTAIVNSQSGKSPGSNSTLITGDGGEDVGT